VSLMLLGLAGAGGCAAPNHERVTAFLRSHEAVVATASYLVYPPDVIAIRAPGAAEIDGTVQQLRPDGKVALQLLGEVYVAGMTAEQIAAKLRRLLARYYVDPEVVVQVAEYRSQAYYVFGEVARPGPVPYTGRDTLLRALALAQPTLLAWRSKIRVVRPPKGEGESEVLVVDLDRMVRTGDPEHNILLQPGDIIEVPPTPLAWLGHRVRELLYPFSPALHAYAMPARTIQATRVYQGDRDHDD